jgi:predicted DNA-binding transcriptional regulator AlpA
MSGGQKRPSATLTGGKKLRSEPQAAEQIQVIDHLTQILRDSSRVREVPLGSIPALLSHIASVQHALTTRLLEIPLSNDGHPPTEGETLLKMNQAAEKLGTSPDWLGRNSDKFPFTVRLGRNQLRFSRLGIDRWIRQRQRK